MASYVLFVMTFFVSTMTANGQETSLVGISQGSELTAAANHLGQGGYELSGGTNVSFDSAKATDAVHDAFSHRQFDFGREPDGTTLHG
ncbi:hypothetical protein [Mesorhizobium sp. L-8-10]|uniref:hypothetical protein n=1 Tax=Mesorhizobium sp. L-8-10 TaxID=2744523 RepID=UPI001FD41D95|nr:hypothetical protein [Mesorhizobium sp. L-8-10]